MAVVVYDVHMDENLTNNKRKAFSYKLGYTAVWDLIGYFFPLSCFTYPMSRIWWICGTSKDLYNAVTESVMDENLNGVVYKRRKVAFDADMDENLANNHRKCLVLEGSKNATCESPDEHFKSLVKRYADPRLDEELIETTLEEFNKIKQFFKLKRSQVVSDVDIDENLTNNTRKIQRTSSLSVLRILFINREVLCGSWS